MLELGELSASVARRRRTLLAVPELAAKSRSHTPLSRWRLNAFRAALDGLEGNDEVEITGETLCEVLMLAIEALEPR